MKRLFSLVLALLLALVLAVPALADIIALPEDGFLEANYQDCFHENRGYYTNGDAGYVTGYHRPGGKADGIVPNGQKLRVSWTYEDEWGYGESDLFTGWVKLDELTPDYDSGAFLADHKEELVEEERTIHTRREDGDALYCYTYPGSGAVKYRLSWDFYVPGETSYDLLYTDPAGRTWGYQHYFQGWTDYWVCLDDPCNGELPADENYVDVLSRLTPAAAPAVLEDAAKAARTPSAWLIAGAGGVVVVAAAIGAAAIKRRRKNAAAPED